MRLLENHISGEETVHGYGLSKDLVQPGPPDNSMAVSTVYRCLSRLQERSLVESVLETDPSGHQGPARRKFKLTSQGRRFAELLQKQ